MTHTTSPMLALMPGTRTAPGTGANTGPRPPRTEHDYRQSCSCPACVLHFQFTDERVFAGRHSRRVPGLARSRLARRRLHPPHPAARRHPPHRPGHRGAAAHHPHPGHAGRGDLQALRQPPCHHLPRLRRNLPPRRLPPHPRRADRRQGHHPRGRHPPRRLRHLHRPLLRPRPHPPGPAAHLHRQDPLHLPARPLPPPPRRHHLRPRAASGLLHPAPAR